MAELSTLRTSSTLPQGNCCILISVRGRVNAGRRNRSFENFQRPYRESNSEPPVLWRSASTIARPINEVRDLHLSEFMVCGCSVHLQIKQPTRCTLSCKICYCLVVETLLNMFRATFRPSSGALLNCIRSIRFPYKGRGGCVSSRDLFGF
jgi:hypothetical protein